jgi:hypothetical protein
MVGLISSIGDLADIVGGVILTAMDKFIGIIDSVGLAIERVIGAIGSFITDIMKELVASFESFAKLGKEGGLGKAAVDIGLLSASIVGFGAGKAIGGFLSRIGNLLGGDALKKFAAFADIGPGLEKAGKGIKAISKELKSFSASNLKAAGKELDIIREQIKSMGKEVRSTFVGESDFSGIFKDTKLDTSPFQNTGNEIEDIFKVTFKTVKKFIKGVWGTIIDMLVMPWEIMRGAVNAVLQKMNEPIKLAEADPSTLLGKIKTRLGLSGTTLIDLNIPLIPEIDTSKIKGLQTKFGEYHLVAETGIATVHEGEAIGRFDFQSIVAEIQTLRAQMAKPEFDLSSVDMAMVDSTKETVATKEEIAKLRIEMGHYFGLGGSSSAKVTGKEVSRRIWGK